MESKEQQELIKLGVKGRRQLSGVLKLVERIRIEAALGILDIIIEEALRKWGNANHWRDVVVGNDKVADEVFLQRTILQKELNLLKKKNEGI